jgi:glycosyltransferase involved in cell wall biosynthesis
VIRRAEPRLISVVMPALDAAGTIGAQLDALADQDFPGAWELVLADCGSTDGTTRALNDSRMEHRVIDASGRGRNRAARARNLGVGVAAGDLLAFCDADDVVAPGWLSAIAAAAQDADLVAGTLDVQALNAAPVHAPRRPAPIHTFLPSLSTANCAIWAEVFAALGGFDEDHPGAEDRDLAWRAQLRGYTLGIAPDAVVAYRYRRTLRETMRQRFRWGLADARLYRDFAPHGMARTAMREAAGGWLWAIATIPLLPWSELRRQRWAVQAPQQAGHVVGSIRQRVLYP